MKKLFFGLLLALFIGSLFFLAQPAHAAIPDTINFGFDTRGQQLVRSIPSNATTTITMYCIPESTLVSFGFWLRNLVTDMYLDIGGVYATTSGATAITHRTINNVGIVCPSTGTYDVKFRAASGSTLAIVYAQPYFNPAPGTNFNYSSVHATYYYLMNLTTWDLTTVSQSSSSSSLTNYAIIQSPMNTITSQTCEVVGASTTCMYTYATSTAEVNALLSNTFLIAVLIGLLAFLFISYFLIRLTRV